MQAQKQIHASQLWQQGLNDVILKSRDVIVDRNIVEFFLARILLYSD